jgi:hypothetical protein
MIEEGERNKNKTARNKEKAASNKLGCAMGRKRKKKCLDAEEEKTSSHITDSELI